jgi:chromosome segregation ATPase
MSKLVDKARLAKLAQALDARAKAAVQAEADRAMAAEEALQGAIDAINNAETGILKQAKDHADAAVQAEKEAREESEELLDGRIGDLEEVIFGGEGAEDGIDKIKSDIQANAEAIAKLNGGAEEEGSVAKAVADGVKPVQDAVDAAEGRLDTIEAEQLTQNAAIEAAQEAADKAQGEVDAAEERITAAEAAIVANKEACEEAMAQEVIDRNKAISDALEPYSTTEEVKGILTNVVSSLDISMADDKLVLKLGGAEGVALSETTLDMATDADIDAIIAGLDAE